MSGQYVDFDDLYVAVIMALTDEQIVGLPHNVSTDELARRFPETFRLCEESLKVQIARESSISSAKFTDSSDGTKV